MIVSETRQAGYKGPAVAMEKHKSLTAEREEYRKNKGESRA
jgi:hypothetical protein